MTARDDGPGLVPECRGQDLDIYFISGLRIRLGGAWRNPTLHTDIKASFEERFGIGDDDLIVWTEVVDGDGAENALQDPRVSSG